jgi:hypothetical protein
MKYLPICLVAVFAFPAAAAAPAADFSGEWTTKEIGDLHVDQSFDSAQGTYTLKHGRVIGTVAGDSFTGMWMQTSSPRRCTSEQNGSVHWGRFTLQMGPGGSYWKGRWSYCDDAEGSGGTWTGNRP